jgi:iron complex outermembrane recepter protein
MPAKGERNSFITDTHSSEYSAQNIFMKLLILCVSMLCVVSFSFAQKQLNDTSYLQPVEVSSVKATDKNPFAKTNLSKADIKKQNIGQDLPFILNNTPSIVVNSDAGNGIGYTGIRIRGTDATRINVTLNGIPYNDAESLGTYFVDMPDIASSASSIQIQRGVGTSANGAGSFGGSINVSTNEPNTKKNMELNSTAGSYGSFKNTLLFNSGIFKNHFMVDAHMSNIRSNGYIDRAATRLSSYFLSSAYVNDKNSVRLNIFTGKEITYQSWNGVNEIALDTNRTFNSAGTEKLGTPYDNQVDNYRQTHYQLFYNHKFNPYLKSNIAFFLTKGKGFYEQYKADQTLTDYGLPATILATPTDLVRQLWLDNNFYGSIFSLQYEKKNTQLIFGGGYTMYDGKHFGEIIWNKELAPIPANHKWYNKTSNKKDFSVYTKWTQKLNANFQTFLDVQIRNLQYKNDGYRDNPTLAVNTNYSFFNPKAGITFSKNNINVYGSIAIANKEPNRDDFEGSVNAQPTSEKLTDIETGFDYKKNTFHFGANFYYMIYKNQLVNTGKINDVGAYTRINIDDSYRAGLEFFTTEKITDKLSITGNVTFSENKVKNFTEYGDDYDNSNQYLKFYSESDISFSPDIIGSFIINIEPMKNANIILTSKYVGSQFLDNTSNTNRKLNAFYTQDARASYTWKGKSINEVNLFLQANNIFSRMYEANGYTYSYILGGKLNTENFYFPMAPATIMLGLNIIF